MSRAVKSLEILLSLQASKLSCHSFMDAGGRHKTPRSETEDFIIQDPAGSICFMSGPAPHDQQGLWLCNVSTCLGWTMPPRILYPVCVWLGWETAGPRGSSSPFVFHAHFSWSTNSPFWEEAVAGLIPPSPGSSFSFSDSWARFECSYLWWRALASARYLCNQGQKQQEEDFWFIGWFIGQSNLSMWTSGVSGPPGGIWHQMEPSLTAISLF